MAAVEVAAVEVEGVVVDVDGWSLSRAAAAVARLAASSASRRAARPQVQSLQARRRLPVFGRHSGAVKGKSQLEGLT